MSVVNDELIDRALQEGWVGAHFQPQVELSSGAIIGAEALLRWTGPNRPDVSTGVLIQVLEAGGHMSRVTDLMLREASEEVRRWEQRGRAMSIAVNISATLLDDVEVADRWLDIVRAAGASPERITFELTEDALATDRLRALDVLTRLRLRGFALAMDDFGSGYSTLSLLSDLPITELKIDRSLVHGAASDWRRRAMIDTIQQLSSRLGLRTVAEGVENADDLHVLRRAGCDVAQGWLFAPAMDWMEFADLVADRSDLVDLSDPAHAGDVAAG